MVRGDAVDQKEDIGAPRLRGRDDLAVLEIDERHIDRDVAAGAEDRALDHVMRTGADRDAGRERIRDPCLVLDALLAREVEKTLSAHHPQRAYGLGQKRGLERGWQSSCLRLVG